MKLWAIAFWLILWQAGAVALGHDILLVSPLRVLVRLTELVGQADFWRSILHSLMRIGGGFLLGTLAAVTLALMAARYRRVRELLAPLMLTVKSVPVASFVILALFWVSSQNLAVLIVFLMVLPVNYLNTLSGIDQIDPRLREMAEVFRIPRLRRALQIELPQVLPAFRTGCQLSLGLCWKAGVAAEVIGMPKGSIGERLQQAKVYLDTPDLFAWTVVILMVSWAFEKLVLRGIVALERWSMGGCRFVFSCRQGEIPPPEIRDIAVEHLSMAFGDHVVLRDVSMRLKAGQVTALMGPSGIGKTTLARILSGLQAPDAGTMRGLDGLRIGMVFQEDRLIEWLNPLENILLTAPNADEAALLKALKSFRLGDSLDQPARELSGGMRRRCALLRALLSPADVLLLDEPFNGLDEDTLAAIMPEVLRLIDHRTTLLITHDAAEAEMMGAEVVQLHK